MTFIFWQNIISLHQAAFLKALAKRHEVILVAEQPLTRERAEEGWDSPGHGGRANCHRTWHRANNPSS